MLLDKLRRRGFKVELYGRDNIAIIPKDKINDELIGFLKKNKQKLIEELKKEKSQQINKIEKELTDSIEPDTFLRVKFDGIDRIVAVCRPEDEEYLKNKGMFTLTTKELALLKLSKTDRRTFLHLIKIKQAFGGFIAEIEKEITK